MRTLFAAMLVLVTGCLPSTKVGWYANPGLRSSALCHWTDVEWHDTGVLLAPGTATPMARAGEAWGHHGAWRGAKVSGALVQAGPYVLFQGRWRGDGLVLDADVDASDAAMLRAYTTVKAGPACILPRGAELVVHGPGDKGLRVTPPREAYEDFMPAAGPLAEMACEALTLYPQDADALEWAGFDKDSPGVLINSTAELPVHDAPGGAVIGRFRGRPEPWRVYRVETRDGWTHVADVDATGVVWHGWVPNASLREPEKSDLSNVFGYGGLGSPRGADETWRACAVENRLYARLASGAVVPVGRVLASTPFRPGDAAGGYVAVSFRNRWLTPEDGVTFVLEASAGTCAKWIPPPEPAVPVRQEPAPSSTL